jgi:hypothetical protein
LGNANPTGQNSQLRRNTIVAMAGLAVGALAGAYGTLQMKRPKTPHPTAGNNAKPNRRSLTLDEKLTQASRIMRQLNRGKIENELEDMRSFIREAG